MSTQIIGLPGSVSDPYVTPDPYTAPNTGTFTGTPGSGVFEITLTTRLNPIISGTTTVNAETYNGAIPGPTFRLTVGDTVIVRLINNMPHETGIHWHGIELANSADGTEVTQNGAVGLFSTPPPAPAPAGGTYLYKFKVTRPGIFWYHPHHHHSTNRVFKGLYGMIIVTDPNEETLADGVVLPLAADTKQIVLSDITVCKAEGMNDPATYPTPAGTEWLGSTPPIQAGATPTTPQPGPTPTVICEIPTVANGMTGAAVDDHGVARTMSYPAGDVPSLETASGRVNEGQTVLTNGVNVGARPGSPSAPGVLVGGHRLPVRPGQGLRLQIVNCATTRYFRLRLTDPAGQKVDLVRVGGEGGVLDHAVLEGLDPMAPPGTLDPKYDSGEILLPPSVRADVVVAIPDTLNPGDVLTLWTRDFRRLEGLSGWVNVPSVPVMHLEVTNDPIEAYTITGGHNGAGMGVAALRARAGFPGPVQGDITTPPTTGSLLTPPGGFVAPKLGMANPDIRLSNMPGPGINGIQGQALHGTPPYTNTPHIGSTRYAEKGRLLELTVTNISQAHHPFHLHGFSMQPVSLAPRVPPPPILGTPPTGTFNWLYKEFRDSIDVPANYTLTFRVQLDDRPLVDGVTLGGWLGRWLFHCHIFFHHHRGMIGEFVVTDINVNERPYVDVGGSWAFAGASPPQRRGTFWSREGNLVTLAASYGLAGAAALTATVAPVVTLPQVGTTPGTWSWTDPGLATGIYYVYVSATDTVTMLKCQAVFRLQVGSMNDAADVGDPHIRTVNGKSYDFQAVGEFILVRDREYGLEIQARQTPVPTANPITDGYSGLTASVSVNTAVAARVGSHQISYQPTEVEGNSRLQFFLDGKPRELSTAGIDLEGHRVSAFDANGETGLRVDFAHGAVLTVAPRLWHIWILDIHVSHTQADEGIMGSISEQTWLPTLPSGVTVGPMPESPHERYITLYKTFADAWRVTEESSLFMYARGTSTETFTDRDWPAETPPSVLKPQFQIPGFTPPLGIPVPEAAEICKEVTIDYLHAHCVFDVATTGDEGFAKAYLLQQDLRLHGSAVQISGDKEVTRSGEPLVVTAVVLPMTSGRPTPTGNVTFQVDGSVVGPSVQLDPEGRAQFTTQDLSVGEHKIRATYTSDGEYHSSTSPNLIHTVKPRDGDGEGTSGCRRTIWIWVLIILILLAIAIGLYFC
ncbi:MAG: multicopper oxidase domain-containing protein [Pyrinomonadaceae bacterium]